jgi:hypothetical protein
MTHDLTNDVDWQELVERFGGAAALTVSAREHKAFLRARGVKDAPTLLRLALMYGPGGLSLRGAAAAAALGGIAVLSDVALLGRLQAAGPWLEALCGERLARLAQGWGAAPAGSAGAERPIRIVDGTRLTGPGGRAMRLHLAYDLPEGRISHCVLTDLSGAETLTRTPVRPGEIRIGDRGYPRPDDLAALRADGADVVVRLTWKSLSLAHRDGRPLAWTPLFDTATAHSHADAEILVEKARTPDWPALPMRLVVIPKPPADAERSRSRARRASAKAQNRIDPRTLAAAGHVLLLTSLPADLYPPQRIAALYRLRWQVELAIKRLKSLLHIDRLPAKDPGLVRAWIHAHLLLALLIDDTAAQPAAFPP